MKWKKHCVTPLVAFAKWIKWSWLHYIVVLNIKASMIFNCSRKNVKFSFHVLKMYLCTINNPFLTANIPIQKHQLINRMSHGLMELFIRCLKNCTYPAMPITYIVVLVNPWKIHNFGKLVFVQTPMSKNNATFCF